MDSANQRLGKLYGTDPTSYTYRAPEAYSIPGTADTPSLADLQAMGAAVASNLSTGKVDSKGRNPTLVKPNNPQAVAAIPGQSYF